MSKADAGAALILAGQHEEAISLLTEGLRTDEHDVGARVNLAVALRNCNRFEEAVHELTIAALLDETRAALWNTLGMIAEDTGNWEQAANSYHLALKYASDAERPQLYLNHAYAAMRLGRFEQAWQHFELGRFGTSWAPPPGPRFWTDEDITGKRLLVILEGGYGDGILFARWFPQLQQMCGQVSFLVWDSLAPLFESAEFPWLDRVIRQGEQIHTSEFDFCAPLMSLPRCLGMKTWSDIPQFRKYIYEDKRLSSQWFERLLSSDGGPNIGLCWRAEENGVSRKHRSIPVEQFEFLRGRRNDAHFHSLCPGVAAPSWMSDHTGSFSCWGVTAAFVANLDQVITADTAVAHLAGALGVPTWIVLPQRSDWKYGTEESGPVWYPSARLFRQKHPTDWKPVMEDVANALAEF